MTRNVISTTLETSLEQVKLIFTENEFHHLPVLDADGRVLGILSKSDLALVQDWSNLRDPGYRKKENIFLLKKNKVKNIMQGNVMTVQEDTSLNKCVDILKENYFHALPVVDNEERLVGMLTMYDLMIYAFPI